MLDSKTVRQDAVTINQHIWLVVAHIPAGTVATYGDVARLAGLGCAARRVGVALRQLPPETSIPWHRVVNAQGRIALPSASQAHHQQKLQLEAEGSLRHKVNRIDMARYRWRAGEATTTQ